MADKAISELITANQVAPTDLFVLEQSGTAKKLTGQTLENWLVSFADGHGGIQSIVKNSTSGLVDTYRITLADTTTCDFTVTNGKAISSVEQTSKAGLTRTYTIAFNDGTSQTFTVTDGRSITNIEKTANNVLTDTYTISYNDGTTSTFTVKNGKGISSFAKVSTVGLVDTYRIEYNDGTSDEFTVTNGAKGDKGDNTYTHIKFASQEPTASSHSMGDVPDKWIGFYWGNSSTAPTDWTLYKWYQFKGDKGDTGNPATLASSSVEYQVSDSGTIIPSGAWQTSIPVVAQGKYLWTRTTNNFNTGNPVVSYSVSRIGLDGSGSVSSVANISPDANGNVPLDAEAVGALPNTGGDLTGELRMNGQPISGLNAPTANDQAANMGFVREQVKNAAPRNLLDNSDFSNLVAQAGIMGTHGEASYLADRWMVSRMGISYSKAQRRLTFPENGQTIVDQWVSSDIAGKTVTLAIKASNVNGSIYLSETVMGATHKDVIIHDGITVHTFVPDQKLAVRLWAGNGGESLCIDWVALYEGAYTVETLPEYRPKGYGAELVECQRYFQTVYNAFGYVNSGETIIGCTLPLCCAMHPNSISIAEANISSIRSNGKSLSVENLTYNITYSGEYASIKVDIGGTFTGCANHTAVIVGTFRLCADIVQEG